jgi:SAM-dependent methyltransferase
MHGTNADIGDLLTEARPLPPSSVSILRCPTCGHTPRTQSFGAGYALSECRLWRDADRGGRVAGAAGRDARSGHVRDPIEPARRGPQACAGQARTARARDGIAGDSRHVLPLHAAPHPRRADRPHPPAPALERLGARKLAHHLAAASLFNDYLRHRYCAPALLSAIPLLGLVRDHDADEAPVLDAPCGMGHLASMLTKIIPQERIVCMDLLPYFAYAARRFFVPDAKFTIAYDMSRPLPLADASFGTIFCLDAIQYIPNKPRVAAEFMRVLGDDGVVAILHAQNPPFAQPLRRRSARAGGICGAFRRVSRAHVPRVVHDRRVHSRPARSTSRASSPSTS